MSVGWCWPRGMASEVSARALGQSLVDPKFGGDESMGEYGGI